METTTNTAVSTAPVTDSDWLPRLATDINHEHELAEDVARTAVQHAYRAGNRLDLAFGHRVPVINLLDQARRRVDYGKWGQWVADNLQFSERTERRYRLQTNKGAGTVIL